MPETCASIARNPRRPVARYLDLGDLQRLGAVLDRHRVRHPWSVAALPRPDDAARVFSEDLTSARLRTFRCGVRKEAGLSTFASTTGTTPGPPRA